MPKAAEGWWWPADSGGDPRARCGERGVVALAAGVVAAGVAVSGIALAQVVEHPEPPPLTLVGSLKGLKPPLPNLDGIVKNRDLAILLGKALFWEVRVGSDAQACASCHFKAGADPRITNQFNPGSLDTRFRDNNGDVIGDSEFGGLVNTGDPEIEDPSPDDTVGLTRSGQVADSNITVVQQDFPLHRLAQPATNNRNARILYTTNDVFSSQGTFDGGFISIGKSPKHRDPGEECFEADATIFHAGPYAARKVEARNTPTVINAVFNHRNFWDGRANNLFNGADPFGRRNTDAVILVREKNKVVPRKLNLENASMASQASGPPLSSFEMSCAGKAFADIGAKLLKLEPLALQEIHPNDSVLGPHRHPSGFGLSGKYGKYDKLVKDAFEMNLWQGPGNFGGFTQMEANFPLFWSVAIMLYESTLVSDDSPFDRYCGANPCDPDGAGRRNVFDAQEELGLQVFLGKGKCVNCHDGPEFTKAATHLQAEAQEEGLVERMLMGDANAGGAPALYDNGFYNIGVRPTVEDLGVGGTDPFGNPLSFTRQYLDELRGTGRGLVDPFQVDPCTFEVPFNLANCNFEPEGAAADNLRVAVDGAFKVPGLRNVALTAPYFHNGGQRNLNQVVDFYNRGGDRRGNFPNDTTGSGPLGEGGEHVADTPIPTSGDTGSNLDPDIQVLDLTDAEQSALVAFMRALTDNRVRCERAPFDHPSLTVPNGHLETDSDGDGRADDILLEIPAVGAAGLQAEGLGCHANSGNLFNP